MNGLFNDRDNLRKITVSSEKGNWDKADTGEESSPFCDVACRKHLLRADRPEVS